MRVCAKMRCRSEAVSTIGLSYEAKLVVVSDLSAEPNPNLVDLCSEHVERLTPPIGWRIRDERSAALAASP